MDTNLKHKENVIEMIHSYVQSVGLKLTDAYDATKQSWTWRIGSATIHVYIETMSSGSYSRDYLRIFSPLMQIPVGNEVVFYRYLLELNDSSLGVKLTIMPDSNWVYATYERDIKGMDYDELATCISDLEWSADKLDDELKAMFPNIY
ncbi:MAG: hypothetical protein EAZ85_09810 [Bacteroidetes bacterium]|nr:MAG: hypothetical protein EAZ85_09810 [Bacteroidota bacterium]TAG93886.1 MAG: hypothetical protein EAZ20_01300 [Bacteroidota bacterium]